MVRISGRYVSYWSAAAAAALLAACGGPGTDAPAISGAAAVRANVRAANGFLRPQSPRLAEAGGRRGHFSSPTQAAKAGNNVIYSGSFDANSITIFPTKGVNPPPIGEITTGLSNPERLFVGKNLKLYATNLGNNTIVAYDPGATSPSLTIGQGVDSPTGLVVGADGTIYCANTDNDTVTVYRKGKKKPARTIALGNDLPENLAIDAANNLYVSYVGGARGSGVVKVPAGQTTGQDLNLVVGSAGAIEVDTSGNIILIDAAIPSVDVFAAGATSPSKVIRVTDGSPFELALNKSEKKLYASIDLGIDFAIEVLDYPKGNAFTDKITSGVGEWPLAVSPDNAL
ncbi:MAG TPA: hypothetical protein VGF86_01035 [Candidatus Tumulicola sp.]